MDQLSQREHELDKSLLVGLVGMAGFVVGSWKLWAKWLLGKGRKWFGGWMWFFFYGWDEDDERFGLEMGSSRKEKISCQRRVSIEVFSEFMIIAIMAIHALGRNQSLNLNWKVEDLRFLKVCRRSMVHGANWSTIPQISLLEKALPFIVWRSWWLEDMAFSRFSSSPSPQETRRTFSLESLEFSS